MFLQKGGYCRGHHESRIEEERSLNLRNISARADPFGGRSIAQEQTQCIDDNGFACSRLSGEDVQPRSKLEFKVVDYGVVSERSSGARAAAAVS